MSRDLSEKQPQPPQSPYYWSYRPEIMFIWKSLTRRSLRGTVEESRTRSLEFTGSTLPHRFDITLNLGNKIMYLIKRVNRQNHRCPVIRSVTPIIGSHDSTWWGESNGTLCTIDVAPILGSELLYGKVLNKTGCNANHSHHSCPSHSSHKAQFKLIWKSFMSCVQWYLQNWCMTDFKYVT